MRQASKRAGRDAAKLGASIRRRRLELGLSLAKLGARSKTDKGHLSLIENGKAEPNLPRLRRIARGLGVQASELLAA